MDAGPSMANSTLLKRHVAAQVAAGGWHQVVGPLVVEAALAVREHLLVEVAAQQALLACHWRC